MERLFTVPISDTLTLADVDCLLNATVTFQKTLVLPGGHTKEPVWIQPQGIPAATPDPSAFVNFLTLKNHSNVDLGHLVYWPTGAPEKPFITIASSRLGRDLDNRQAWFRALRAACSRFAERDQVVLNIAGTTAARFLPRATELFATTRIDAHLASPKLLDLSSWWNKVANTRLETSHSGTLFNAFVSPIVALQNPETIQPQSDSPCNPVSLPLPETQTPHADSIADRMASEIYALHVRDGGQIHRLLQERLGRESGDSQEPLTKRVHLAIGKNLNSQMAQKELLESGAVGWYLYPSSVGTDQNEPSIDRERKSSLSKHQLPRLATTPSVADLPDHKDDAFLTHCTRRRIGPWPTQSSKSYLDDLILEREGFDHSPFAALQRIIGGRELLASSTSIRGGSSVVSFTSVPLEELQSLRVFRPHRGRWDFEPYGISIRQSALEQAAKQADSRLQPVNYANPEDWDALDDSKRPFFQTSHSHTRSGNILDWTAEQEWRFLGNVDLSEIQPDDAIVFVRTEEERSQLELISPWQIVRLDS